MCVVSLTDLYTFCHPEPCPELDSRVVSGSHFSLKSEIPKQVRNDNLFMGQRTRLSDSLMLLRGEAEAISLFMGLPRSKRPRNDR
jgi:hypothetical protein